MRAGLRERDSAEREGRPEFWYWEMPMELKDEYVGPRAGTTVRVREDYRKPHRLGAIGTIKKRYGGSEYTAYEVSFPDGQTELFWEHQLERAKGLSFKPEKRRRWWLF